MKYEVTYTKTSTHTIDIEADTIPDACREFTNDRNGMSAEDLENRERICVSERVVTSVTEEEP